MGRSRKPPEAVRAARQHAARVRHHGPEAAAKLVPPARRRPSTGKSVELESIDDYDKLLGQPLTWDDAKKRESVQGEIIDNERKRDERAIARRSMFTPEQVDAMRDHEDEAIFSELAGLPDAMAEFVPPESKHAAHKAAKAWIAAFRERVSKRFEEIRA